MPAALVPVFAAAGLTGGLSIGGISVSFASIAAYGVSLGATFGASKLINSLERRHQNTQITVRQSIPARVRGYGRVMMGGAMYYMGANRVLVQGIVFCEGPIDGYEQVYLNDLQIDYTPGSLFTFAGWTWGDWVMVDLQLGTPGQWVNPAFAEAGHDWIDSSFQNQGLALGVIRCYLPNSAEQNFSKTYPNGVPVMRVVARLAQVYDPRNGATAWSQNPALCIMDFLTSSRGYNISSTRINTASFIAMANLCDEAVPLAAGGTEPRYQFNGVYMLFGVQN